MRIGEIFRWRDFPHQLYGDVKPRYFIYMGKTNFEIDPSFAYLYTTTGKLEYYTGDGKRANNSHLIFRKDEYCFTSDCVLDVDMGLHEIELSEIDNNESSIDLLARLTEEKIIEIYNYILGSSIAKIKKIDIHSSLNLSGITGLKRP